MWHDTRVLVLGGTGFIGLHLVRRLVTAGVRVSVVDDASHGAFAAVLPRGVVSVVMGDVRGQAAQDWPCDVVFNLASPTGPLHVRRRAVDTLLINVQAAQLACEIAALHGAVAVQASTAEVYGEPAVHPQPESYAGNVEPAAPGGATVYAEAKRAAEALCMAWAHERGIALGIARIFNTYGPGMALDDERVLPRFLVAALARQPLPVRRPGTQTRSFCHVDDTVGGLLALAEGAAMGTVNGPVNIGNPAEISIGLLAGMVNNLTGNPAGIAWQAPLVQDPARRCPDITRARDVLDWAPLVPLDEGLPGMVADFQQRMGVGNAEGAGRHADL